MLCTALAGCSTSSATPAGQPALPTHASSAAAAPVAANASDTTKAPDTASPSDTPAVPSEAVSGSACSLVTAQDATKAIGQPMAVSGDSGTICVFSATADPSTVLGIQTYADVQSMAPMTQLEPTGEHLSVGDGGFWVPGIIFVHKGNRAFSATAANNANPDALKANFVALATTVLGRF